MREHLMELLSTSGSLSMDVIVIRMVAASLIGLIIYMSYWLSHSGSIYSKKFNITLVGMVLITTTVMIVIGNNLALSLGMVGALSIVRYRTAVKDSRDTFYIFWAIVGGICCGAGDYYVAAIGSAFVFLFMLLFGRIKNVNRVLLLIRTVRTNEDRLEALLFQRFGRKAVLRVKNTTENTAEFVYELNKHTLEKDRKNSQSLTDAVYALGSVDYFNVVTQNDDISS